MKKLSLLLVTSLLILTGSSLLAPHVKADEATWGLVRLDRMKAQAVATGGTVCLNPSSNNTVLTTVAVTFSNGDGATTGFTLSGTAADFDATVSDLPNFGQYPGTTATAFPGIDGETPVVADHTITYTVAETSLASGTVYCFNFGAGLTPRTTPASNLEGTIQTNGTNDQLATYSVATITEDQIGVTASVPTILNLALTDTSLDFGDLSTTTVSTQTLTATIGTNAKAGWVSWITNTTNGLYSTSQSSAISVPTGVYGTIYDMDTTTGYVLDVVPGTGSPSIDTAYDGDGNSSGGIMDDIFRQMAFKTTPGSADTLTINLYAKVTNTQAPADDYADTLTIATAGEF